MLGPTCSPSELFGVYNNLQPTESLVVRATTVVVEEHQFLKKDLTQIAVVQNHIPAYLNHNPSSRVDISENNFYEYQFR